jgi:hypothetical protein
MPWRRREENPRATHHTKSSHSSWTSFIGGGQFELTTYRHAGRIGKLTDIGGKVLRQIIS